MTDAEGSQRPRLLVLASTYPRWAGDPEPGFVHELAKRLTGEFEVTVLGPHAAGAMREEIMDGVRVLRYRYAPVRWETLVNDGGIVTNLRRHPWKSLLVPTFVFAQAWRTWRLLRAKQVDVIHAHWLIPQGLIAAATCAVVRPPVGYLVTSHGADLFAMKGSMLRAINRLVVRRAHTVTVVSSAMRDELARIGAEAHKLQVLPMGVDLAGRFTPDDSVPRSRDEILFVGRLVEKKGLRHLLDALPAILEARPRATLTIAGFGPQQAALRAQAELLGVQEKVTFLGAVPQQELPSLYRRAALLVAPFVQAASGDQEGLGLVVVEALGCGCPVLAGDVAAARDMPVERVRANVPAELANAVSRMLAGGEAMSTAVSRQRDECLRRFDWGAIAAGYAASLRLVVRRP
jgi:glycosyltransferase involved in cell wall biosynthesis